MQIDFKKRLSDLFDVNLETGSFFRKTTQGSQRVGALAGAIRPDGYVQISVDGKHFLAHRLVWFVLTETWPSHIDHIDGNKANNGASNLRPVTASLNGRNQRLGKGNASGVLGVRYREDKFCYVAFWLDENGKKRQKNFSCAGKGHELAKQQASDHRRKMIDALNSNGGGYTSNHGAA